MDDEWAPEDGGRADPAVVRARETVLERFAADPKRIYYSKQLEVLNEKTYFHWITNRALRSLQAEGVLEFDTRPLPTGQVTLVNHPRHRYPVRDRNAVGELVAEFSSPAVGESLGHNGEQLVLGGFARSGFTLVAEESRSYRDQVWTETGHDLDQIWVKDGTAYGVEVKNTWSYLDKDEFDIKIKLARSIGVVPVFAVRMIPGDWIAQLHKDGGFALIFGWQMYPLWLRGLAGRIAKELELPADSPRRLRDGTMQRMLNFHERVVARNA